MTDRVKPVADRRWFQAALAALLVIHGVIHVLAPLAVWNLATFEDIDGEPTVALSKAVADALGVAWLVVLVLFVAAGIGVLVRRRWWAPLALVAAVASQVLIVLWWEGAWRGTIANALIVAAVWLVGRDDRMTKQGA